jgi:hypothetical protein
MTKQMIKLALVLALSYTGAVQASTAAAQDINLSYQFQFDSSFNNITINNIAFINSYQNGSGIWWSSTITPDSNGNATINDPFPKSSSNIPLTAIGIGLVSDLPGDAAPGTEHVVLFADTAAVNSAAGSDWSTIFAGTSEQQLISDIQNSIGTQSPDSTVDPAGAAVWQTAFQNVWSFGSTTASAFNFNLGAFPSGATTPTTVTSNFSVIAFSNGQTLGTGTNSLTYSPAATVPEPSLFLCFASGLLALFSVTRRTVKI